MVWNLHICHYFSKEEINPSTYLYWFGVLSALQQLRTGVEISSTMGSA
jgi:hypothetical protein